MTDTAAVQLAVDLDRARALHQSGRLSLARQIYQDILSLNPLHFDTLNLMGVLSAQSREFAEAIEYFDRAIAAEPQNSSAYCNRGLALKELGQIDGALISFEKAIALNHEDAVAHYSRATLCQALGRVEDALAGYTQAVESSPHFATAHYQRALLLQQSGRLEAALAGYDEAIRLKPDYAEACASRAFLLHRLKRFEAALASYDQVIAIKPAHATTYVNRGNALKEMNRLESALASYDMAIHVDAEYAEAYSNRGLVLYRLDRVEDALKSFERAVELKPDYADAYFNRASILRAVKNFERATADFQRAASLTSDIKFLAGACLEVKLQVCDWTRFEDDMAQIIEKIDAGKPAAHPFALLTFADSPEHQRKAAEIWVRETCPFDDSLGPISATQGRAERIRLGYFSGDFREHPVSRLLVPLIENHDRSRFEVIAFSFGPDTQDDLRKRLERSFDLFCEVRDKSNLEIASMARQMGIDIAIDLGGYTHGSRPNVFAMRAAPVQVNYLGYPGTMGATYMDYIVADRTLVPAAAETAFTEKIVSLPNSYFASDPQQCPESRHLTRERLGLPQQAFVYCCFNNDHKILPKTFDRWMRILARVPTSVLWLLEDNPMAAARLRRQAGVAGILPDRLVFCGRVTLSEHLARHRAADLFLDTLPYNAHTTANDALREGLPILTCVGNSFAGRVAASLLRSLDMPELIASTPDEYEETAIRLGTDPDYMKATRAKLEENKLIKPLFDTSLLAKHLESAYEKAHARHTAGLPPAHIHVAP